MLWNKQINEIHTESICNREHILRISSLNNCRYNYKYLEK